MQPCAAYYRSIDSPDCIASESEAELSSSWWRCVDAALARGERDGERKEREKKEEKKGGRRKEKGKKKKKKALLESSAGRAMIYTFSSRYFRRALPSRRSRDRRMARFPHTPFTQPRFLCISLLIHVCTRRELLRVEIGRRARQDRGRFVPRVPRARNHHAGPLFHVPAIRYALCVVLASLSLSLSPQENGILSIISPILSFELIRTRPLLARKRKRNGNDRSYDKFFDRSRNSVSRLSLSLFRERESRFVNQPVARTIYTSAESASH